MDVKPVSETYKNEIPCFNLELGIICIFISFFCASRECVKDLNIGFRLHNSRRRISGMCNGKPLIGRPLQKCSSC